MTYEHLSRDERCQIHALRVGGFSKREIAEQLGRAPPLTIAREIARNTESDDYDTGRAHAAVGGAVTSRARGRASA